MTLSGPRARGAFREADAYAETMAPSLRTMAIGVVYRAALQPGERILDVGTGTGIGVETAQGDGRIVIGLDASPEMLAVARRSVPDHEFVEANFTAIPFPDGSFDVLMSVHALLFADDPVIALREWRRVTRPGGRLSLSVPGPVEHTPWSIYREIYERHGVATARGVDYPSQPILKQLAIDAGWASVATDAEPRTAIRLADERLFERWVSIGSRGAALRDRTAEEGRALVDEMMAATPRDARRRFVIPFGTLYLTARNP